MEKKTQSSLEEFSAFTDEKEKALLKWILIGDSFFLTATLILEFIAEEIFELGILKWSHYWILFAANIFMVLTLFFSWFKNFKIWLMKYLFATYIPLLLSAWMYFTGPKYSSSIFGTFPAGIVTLGLMFYDVKLSLLSVLAGTISYGLLLFHYSRIGFLLDFYEIALNYIIFFLYLGIVAVLILRIRFFKLNY